MPTLTTTNNTIIIIIIIIIIMPTTTSYFFQVPKPCVPSCQKDGEGWGGGDWQVRWVYTAYTAPNNSEDDGDDNDDGDDGDGDGWRALHPITVDATKFEDFHSANSLGPTHTQIKSQFFLLYIACFPYWPPSTHSPWHHLDLRKKCFFCP